MPHRQLRVKTTAPLVKIISHLEELIRALKTGNLTLSNRQEVIALYPGAMTCFSLAAEATLERHELREKLILQLKWKRKAKAAWDIKPVTQRPPVEPSPEISITSLHDSSTEEQESRDDAGPSVPPAAAEMTTSVLSEPPSSAPATISDCDEDTLPAIETAQKGKSRRSNQASKQPAAGRKKRPRTTSARYPPRG